MFTLATTEYKFHYTLTGAVIPGSELTNATVEIYPDTDDDTAILNINVDFYGYPLTQKGERDKRSRYQRVFVVSHTSDGLTLAGNLEVDLIRDAMLRIPYEYQGMPTTVDYLLKLEQ